MWRHEDYCTHVNHPEDMDILTRKVFDVNMRLYKTSNEYRAIVLKCAYYIRWNAQTEKEGYKKPHGFSGANAGIPFNIIATTDEVMINPKIISSTGTREGLSNCGSLTLSKPIKIRRHSNITVEYFNLAGVLQTITGYLPTVQHEIEHNLGVLITDREVK